MESPRDVASSKPAAVIKACGLGVRFGGVEALRDVSFAIDGPQIVGVLGPNGAGKTTLIEVLEGLRSPGTGHVELFGTRVEPRRYPRARIGAVMQREFVLDRITVGDYAELFAAIYGVPGGTAAIIARAELTGRHKMPVEKLSGGEAQRLFIAAALVHDPALLFLDEPTSQLDPDGKARIGATLRAMARERTIVLATHDLREADAVCDSVMFLLDGRVRAFGRRDDLVAAVPSEARKTGGLEDAFFHYCAASITPQGSLA